MKKIIGYSLLFIIAFSIIGLFFFSIFKDGFSNGLVRLGCYFLAYCTFYCIGMFIFWCFDIN